MFSNPKPQMLIFNYPFNNCTAVGGDDEIEVLNVLGGFFASAEKHKFHLICVKKNLMIIKCNL